MPRLARLGFAIALFGALALMPQAPAFAALPPPPFTCQDTGGGSICRADFQFPVSFVVTSCGSGASAFNVVFTFNTDDHTTLYFNQADLLTTFKDHFTYTDQTFTNSVSGKTITAQNDVQNDTFTFTYDASGNLVNETHTQTGAVTQITLAGQGVVVHQTGLGVYDVATGQVVDGGHPQLVFQADLNAGTAYQAFCTALA